MITIPNRLPRPRPRGRAGRVAHLAVLGCALVAWAGIARADSYPHVRDGWTLGFGLGGAYTGHDREDVTHGMAASARVIYAFAPWLGVGIDSRGWSNHLTDPRVTESVFAATFNLYPGERGWFVRLGAGVGSERRKGPGGTTTTYGASVMLGGGVEFRLGPQWSIGPEANLSAIHRSGSVNGFGALEFQVNRYFLPGP